MKVYGHREEVLWTQYRRPGFALAFMVLLAALPADSFAHTIRSKSDLRYWETVIDRSASLSWPWEAHADSARLTFSNRLTRAVTTVEVVRATGASRGECPHPAPSASAEALVAATLVQYSGHDELSRQSAELAYAPGVAGGAIVVRTKADRAWSRVAGPRMGGFDATWWNVAGPSGYEVFSVPEGGQRRFVRAFQGVGIVDAVVLACGKPRFWMSFR